MHRVARISHRFVPTIGAEGTDGVGVGEHAVRTAAAAARFH
jgi:hypothetical protein